MEGWEIFEYSFHECMDTIVDPLDAPDEPGNLPSPERYLAANTYGFDIIPLLETRNFFYRTWNKYAPYYFQWNPLPPEKRVWSVVRKKDDYYDLRDHYDKHLKEIEICMSEGHSRILIEPRHAAEYFSYFARLTTWSRHYAYKYGVITILACQFYPKLYWFYLTTWFLSISNAYVDSRFCRADRLEHYDYMEEESMFKNVYYEFIPDDVGEIEEYEEYPKTSYYLLKLQNRIKTTLQYLKGQASAVTSGLFLALKFSQTHIECKLAGPPPAFEMPTSWVEIIRPTYNQEYFIPDLSLPLLWRYVDTCIPITKVPGFRFYRNYVLTFDTIITCSLFAFYTYELATWMFPGERPPKKFNLKLIRSKYTPNYMDMTPFPTVAP